MPQEIEKSLYEPEKHYSYAIERAVLGVCLIEKNAFGTVYELMKREMFYHEGHKQVFETMAEMYREGAPIDLLTVNDFLQRKKGITAFGVHNTAYFLAGLTNDVVNSTHTAYHCHILTDMWREREMIAITKGGLKEGLTGAAAAADLVQRVQALREGQSGDDFVDMSTLMVQLYRHQQHMILTGGVGIPCGMKVIDKGQGGFHPGDMIVVGARPSVGKSALMGQWALAMAHQGFNVGIISLEMSNVQIAGRLAAIDTQTDFAFFYKGLKVDERATEQVYNRVAASTSNLPIYVSEKTGLSIIDIKAKATKMKRVKGMDILMIDYLQLIDPLSQKNNRNREQEVSEMSRGCKLLAKELGIPVIVLAQLNREVTKRKGGSRYPELSDLRESGSLEQDADAVMFLHKDYMSGIETNEDGYSTENEADLVIAKWRGAESNFRVPLNWNGPRMQFEERQQTSLKRLPPGLISHTKEDDPF